MDRLKPNDDDLLIELEDAPESFATLPDEEIEEAKGHFESPDVPPEDDDEIVEAAPRAPKAEEEPAEEENTDSYERMTAAEERARQVEAGSIWQIAQKEAQIADQARNSIKVGLANLDMRLREANGQLALAEDAGDRAAAREIEDGIRQIKDLKAEFQASERSVADPQAILDQGRNRAHQVLAQTSNGKPVGQGLTARHPLAEQWAKVNGWVRTNKAANRDLISFSEAMTREGYDPNSRGFYHELGRRLGSVHPTLKIQSLQAKQRAPGKASAMRSPVAPSRGSSSGSSGAASRGQFKLTADEQTRMKRMNLDPKNKQHQQAWAKQRIASANRAER